MADVKKIFGINTYSYTLNWSAADCIRHLADQGYIGVELMMYPGHLWPDLDASGRVEIGPEMSRIHHQLNADIALVRQMPDAIGRRPVQGIGIGVDPENLFHIGHVASDSGSNVERSAARLEIAGRLWTPAQHITLTSSYDPRQYHADNHQHEHGNHHAGRLTACLRLDDHPPDALLGTDELTEDHADQCEGNTRGRRRE